MGILQAADTEGDLKGKKKKKKAGVSLRSG